MSTRVRVAVADDGWEVRLNGQPLRRYRLKDDAVSDARRLARERQPHARVDVQSKFTGTWKTLVTW